MILKRNLARLFLVCILFVAPLCGQLKLPRLISNGMVLQRDSQVKIWGWAGPGKNVSVKFIDSIYSAKSDSSGEWFIVLRELKAGGPFRMQVISGDTLVLSDILVGDVWICSGQSNMELPMKRVSPIYQSEIANSENNNIRYFSVPQKYDFNESRKDLASGSWKAADPVNVLNFSAVSYFFGKELYDTYKVPIGLINASLGGSPAEAWLSGETLKKFPIHYAEADKFKDSSLINLIESYDRNRIQAWYSELRKKDDGFQDPGNIWYTPSLNLSGWRVMKVPGYWRDTKLGPVNGVVWFRRDFQVSGPAAGSPAKMNLGRIVDADSVFVNGIFIGATSYQYPPRRYEIPAGILKKGRNEVVVRVISESGNGGFVPDKPYEIIAGGRNIDLKGTWYYKLGAAMEPLEGQTFIRWKPVGLYNAMINPLLSFRIKGVIWYQGESNAWDPVEYKELFPALIRDWRMNWKQGDFPFLYVQLPNFMEQKRQPGESNWALMREAQLCALSLPKTGMAVAIDIGEWNDIHPLNKKEVGKRLALAAQKIAYGDDKIVYSGPVYRSMEIKNNRIILAFGHLGGGLAAKDGGELKYFAIAGADKKFYWAKAKIAGDKVVVWSERILKPVAVRYAWADNPQGANLYNKEGLPASPFRTDIWTTE